VLAEVDEDDREAWLFQLLQAIAKPEVHQPVHLALFTVAD
jgi:hypothetical protein